MLRMKYKTTTSTMALILIEYAAQSMFFQSSNAMRRAQDLSACRGEW